MKNNAFLRNIKKYIYTLFLAFVIMFPRCGVSAPYPGCDCTALKACEVAACASCLLGLCCAAETGRWMITCACKSGGMAHCTNWDTDLVNCSDVNLNYCSSDSLSHDQHYQLLARQTIEIMRRYNSNVPTETEKKIIIN